jgi:phage shock protein A
MTELEKTSLEHHVELCEMRYQQLDSKLNRLHTCVEKVSKSVDDLAKQLQIHITQTNNKIQTSLIWCIGGLATAIGALMIHLLFK